MTTKTESTHVDTDIRVGTQIAYVPPHANGDLGHMAVEYGFVAWMTPGLGACLCRFWRRDLPGVLRTTSCSEGVDTAYLVVLPENDPHYISRKTMVHTIARILNDADGADGAPMGLLRDWTKSREGIALARYLVKIAVALE